jgi:hypothetical protein
MSAATDRLPRRFPVGTHYIVEGAPDDKGTFRVTSRVLVFPDGRELHLPAPATGRHQRTMATRQKTPPLRASASRLRARSGEKH